MTATTVALTLVTVAVKFAAEWKILEKMGEKGWKALVPFYGEYLLFKHIWNTKMFWATLGGSFVTSLLYQMAAHLTGTALVVSFGLATVAAIAMMVVGLCFLHRLSKSFGHGKGFTAGLLLAQPIFNLILGFGKSEYVGA